MPDCPECKTLKLERDEEKARRIYYQDKLYAVALLLDSPGRPIVTGTKDSPSDEIIEAVRKLKLQSRVPRL